MTLLEYWADLRACQGLVQVTQYGGDADLVASAQTAVNWIGEVQRARGTVHLIGNGGSGEVAGHIQNDLAKAGKVRAQVHQDIGLLTACANDLGYSQVYAMPLSLWMEDDDLLIAISSSGSSPNILEAVRVARKACAAVITFTGFKPDNPLRSMGDLNFYVPSHHYGHVETTHETILHYMADEVARA